MMSEVECANLFLCSIPNATIKKYNKSEDVKDNDMVSSDMELSVIRNHRLSQLEEEDDADFYLNYHPPGPVGCEGVAHDFHIPIVSIGYLV
jgi:hypothetical protein